MRESYIATQSIVIQALGRIGNYYISHQDEMKDGLLGLERINWSRSAKQWYMRAVGKNGRIITSKKAALLISNVIKKELGIALSAEEINAEEALKKTIKD